MFYLISILNRLLIRATNTIYLYILNVYNNYAIYTCIVLQMCMNFDYATHTVPLHSECLTCSSHVYCVVHLCELLACNKYYTFTFWMLNKLFTRVLYFACVSWTFDRVTKTIHLHSESVCTCSSRVYCTCVAHVYELLACNKYYYIYTLNVLQALHTCIFFTCVWTFTV